MSGHRAKAEELLAGYLPQPAAPTTNALAQAYSPSMPQQIPPQPEPAQLPQIDWRTAQITPYQMQGNALAGPVRYDTTGYLTRRNG